jgi:hypothetical protein
LRWRAKPLRSSIGETDFTAYGQDMRIDAAQASDPGRISSRVFHDTTLRMLLRTGKQRTPAQAFPAWRGSPLTHLG